jgi:hypothetical protein
MELKFAPNDGRYDDFVASVAPAWRADLKIPRRWWSAPFSVIDVSSTGEMSVFQVTQPEFDEIAETYDSWLHAERQALRTGSKDLKTRLVLFQQADFVLLDLYGAEFRIHPSFFLACDLGSSDPNRWRASLLKEDPPTFVDMGKGWCAKIIGEECDHPLTRNGVSISEIGLQLVTYLTN